jgi:hypothetical protein
MTLRYGQQITSIGLATCGKGGARLAARLGIRTTRQTILRRIMDLPDFPAESILFLGRIEQLQRSHEEFSLCGLSRWPMRKVWQVRNIGMSKVTFVVVGGVASTIRCPTFDSIVFICVLAYENCFPLVSQIIALHQLLVERWG